MRESMVASVLSLGLSLLGATTAHALSITYVTPAGSSVTDGAVNASAAFVTGSGTVTVTLRDLLANPKSVGQLISDLFFSVEPSLGATAASLSSSWGVERTVAGAPLPSGDFTDGPGSVATHWLVATLGASRYHLDRLAAPGQKDHLIIGPPGPSGLYSNANGSIADNDPHNPFLAEVATFTVAIAGVTSLSTITEATFSFGTTAGSNVPGVPDGPPVAVPEPTTMLLWATALAGGGLARWRSRRRSSSSRARSGGSVSVTPARRW